MSESDLKDKKDPTDQSNLTDQTDQKSHQRTDSFREDSPSGDHSEVEPPGPIPNPEVKRFSANGSETIGLVRVGRRQVYAPFMVT